MKYLLIALVFLSACDRRGADGYAFESPTHTRSSFSVDVVLLTSKQNVAAELAARLSEGGNTSTPIVGEVRAFSTLRADGCTIYAVDPAIDYQPEYLGHELVHCIYGEWHKAQP